MERQKSISLKPRPFFVMSFVISSSLLLSLFFWFYIELPFQAPQAQFSFNRPSLSLDLKATEVDIFTTSTENIAITEANLSRSRRSDVGFEIVDSSSIKTLDYVEPNLNNSLRSDVGFGIVDSSSNRSFDSVEVNMTGGLYSDVGFGIVDSSSNRSFDSVEANLTVSLHSEAGFGIAHDSFRDKSLQLAGGEDMSQNRGNIIEKKSQSKEKLECDIYSGRWVFDEEYPLYSSDSCPYIDEGFNCDGNGRRDKGYMRWRWRPNDCEIPRFSGANMLELIRGKRLVFVGDSINRNQWESMLCLLLGAVKDRSRVFEARGRRITKGKGSYKFKFLDYHCSVEYYLSHFLVHEGKARVGQKQRQTLGLIRSIRVHPNGEVLMFWCLTVLTGGHIQKQNLDIWLTFAQPFNSNSYYQEGDQVHRHLDVLSAFRRALVTWGSWVDRYAIPGNTRVFFRSSAPSHFRRPVEYGGRCDLEREPIQNSTSLTEKIDESRLAIAEEVIKQMKTPVTLLNVTRLSKHRIDGHPSIYGRKPVQGLLSSVQDCSHWCLPGVPDTWNELLYYYLHSEVKTVSTV